ncbi:pimeloyl-ACP methyl ester carboxylesterase [Promicromonospora sp. AC04]|uniref:alpha/beta fold hydrolase n=1 Tax=Promicromonospora sp. AC04 TaxID=2135723 RepID=UPI000D3A5036|nr:alpha/beta hydrolase [Promicromonospora sp. AC04]PUB28829.1 pimeloyl-ACP methyl ester carboxylesterase [Promicromonospora sp. AC04]
MTITPVDAFTTSADGTRIAYDLTGPGRGLAPAIVVVDGVLSHRLPVTLAVASALGDRATTLRYDRRGRGGSGDNPPYSVDREVDDIAALLEVTGPAALLGISSGAFLALRAAADLGDGVTGVLCYEAAYDVASGEPPVDPRMIAGVEACIEVGDPGSAVELFLDVVGMPCRLVPRMRASASWADLESIAPTIAYDGRILASVALGRRALMGRWHLISQPVLVVDGTASAATVAAAAESLAAVLPAARRVTLPGHGTDVPPEAMAEAVASLLGVSP